MIIHYIINFISFGGSVLANLTVFFHLPGINVIMPISAIIEIVILYYIYIGNRFAALVYGLSKGLLGVLVGILTCVVLYKFNQKQIAITTIYSLTSIVISYMILIYRKTLGTGNLDNVID